MSDEDDIPLEQGDVWPGAAPGLHPRPALDNYKPTNFPAPAPTIRHLNPPTQQSWTGMSPGMRDEMSGSLGIQEYEEFRT